MGDDKKAAENNGDVSENAPPPELPPPAPLEVATPQVVESIVKGCSQNLEVVDYKAELGSKIGDNYMSIMYAVDINTKDRGTGENGKLSVMLKTMPRNVLRQQMINDTGAFLKESNIYKLILPKMLEFQKQKGLKDEDLFQAWPKCYVSFHDGKEDYIGLENLKEEGYKMGNRIIGLDPDHISLVLKNLAKFHAISYAMWGGDRKKLMAEHPWLEERMFLKPELVQDQFKIWMKHCLGSEAELVKSEGFDKEAEALAQVVDEHFFKDVNELLEGDSIKYPSVILHADCWTNNFLFKYSETAGKPVEMKLVDFQITRVAPRSCDLGYFFHSSLSISELNEREDHYLKMYHDEFTSFLGKLGAEVGQATWENLQEEYKEYKFFGVVMGLMLTPIVGAAADDVKDMEEIKEEDFNEEGLNDFITTMIKSNKSQTAKKICNLAINHLSKCVRNSRK